jgi:hypothetical protein
MTSLAKCSKTLSGSFRLQHRQATGIRPEDVLPLSAKQAKLAKVQKIPIRFARSSDRRLEKLLRAHHRAKGTSPKTAWSTQVLVLTAEQPACAFNPR